MDSYTYALNFSMKVVNAVTDQVIHKIQYLNHNRTFTCKELVLILEVIAKRINENLINEFFKGPPSDVI